MSTMKIDFHCSW